MVRMARVVVPGHLHHVVQRGSNQMPVFGDDEDREHFLGLLIHWTRKTNTRAWAYCLMDNHFHLLLVPEQPDSLSKCIHGSTCRYALDFNEKYGRSGRLWQNRYFSCPVDQEDYLWTVIRYIERNPVRAQIVARAEDWPWSSAAARPLGRQDQLLSRPGWVSAGASAFRVFVERLEADRIRRATATGRPLGGIGFYQMLEQRTGRNLTSRRVGRPKKRTVVPGVPNS